MRGPRLPLFQFPLMFTVQQQEHTHHQIKIETIIIKLPFSSVLVVIFLSQNLLMKKNNKKFLLVTTKWILILLIISGILKLLVTRWIWIGKKNKKLKNNQNKKKQTLLQNLANHFMVTCWFLNFWQNR